MHLSDTPATGASSTATNPDGCQAWLNRYCQRLGMVEEGLVVWCHDDQWLPVALWPTHADARNLLPLVDEVVAQSRGQVDTRDDGSFALGYPIRQTPDAQLDDISLSPGATAAGAVIGVVVLRVVVSGEQALVPIMQRLEDAVAVLERDTLQVRYRQMVGKQRELSRHLSLLAEVLAEDRFNAAGMQLVTRLAALYDAERVSLGWRRGSRCRVVQISHSAQFNRKMNRVRATEGAMDEALDQLSCVAWPSDIHGPVARAHGQLCEMTGHMAAVSVPCLDDDIALGALTLERERPFEDHECQSLESLAALCTRSLDEKRRNDRPLPMKIVASLGEQFGRLIGAGHLGYKVAGLSLVAFLAFAALATGSDRIAADATLESRIQRVLAAPYRGYLKESLVRAGDIVESGEVLARLDTRDLLLEQMQWQSELAKLDRQYQEMRAMGDRAALNIIAAQRKQLQAHLALVNSRLERAELTAPFDGIVISGDLTQRLGGVLEQGEELFRVSPLDGYRLDLEVRENRIDDIRVGQHGELVLAALTTKTLPFIIERITPETLSSEGETRFIVEARLERRVNGLRPGMQGVAKVDAGEGRLLALWTRGLLDWLQLTAWRYWG